ncbi:MAG: nucleotidyltransferase family protein [Patescibacteria group bacterium]|nr:nucleotidyltransferase family protein [Patescibacteria group bacterium]
MKSNPLAKYQKSIAKIAKTNHVSYLALFGSYARNEQKKNSDIDLLVEFNKPVGLIHLIHTEHELEDTIGKKVDLITKAGLNKYIKPYIQDDLMPIYGKNT